MTAVLLWENQEHKLQSEVDNRGKTLLVKGMWLQNKSSWEIRLSFGYVRIAFSPKRPSNPSLTAYRSKYCRKAEAALDRLSMNNSAIVSHLHTSPLKQCQVHTDVARAIRRPARCLQIATIKQREDEASREKGDAAWHFTREALSEESPKFCLW